MARKSGGQTQVYSMQGWSGGLNLSQPLHRLQPNELSDCNGIFINNDSSLQSFDAIVGPLSNSVATDQGANTLFTNILNLDGTNFIVVLTELTGDFSKIYKGTIGGAWTQITSTTPATWDTFFDCLFYVQGVYTYVIMADGTKINYWRTDTATASTVITGGPEGYGATAMAIKDDRLFTANVANGTKGRIFFTEPGIWTTLPAFSFLANNYIDLPSKDHIRGLKVFADTLYIFTQRNIYALYGNSSNNYQLKEVITGTGLFWGGIFNFNLIATEIGIFFCGENDIYLFDGNTCSGLCGDKNIYFTRSKATQVRNLAWDNNSQLLFWCNAYNSTTDIGEVFIYSYRDKKWCFINKNLFPATTTDFPTLCYIVNDKIYYFMTPFDGTATTHRIFWNYLMPYTDAANHSWASTATPYFTTAPINFGTQNPKLLRALKFTGFWYNKSTSDLTITVYLDNKDTSYTVPAANITINGAGTTDFDSLHEIYIGLPAGLIARNFRVKMQYTTYPMRVKPFDWHYQILPDRKIDW